MTPTIRISTAERQRRLGWVHRLTPSQRVSSVEEIVNDLVCLHSSDPATVYLSICARMIEPSIQHVDDALYVNNIVVRHHSMRRTLWVSTPEVARITHASATSRLASQERKRTVKLLEQQPTIDDGAAWMQQAMGEVLDTVRAHPDSSTRELGALLPHLRVKLELAPGKSYAATQAAISRVLLALGFEGEIVRTRPAGRWNNSQYRWAPMESRIPEGIGGLDVDEAASLLASRWLEAFGPAPLADFQWWTGWPKGLTQKAILAAGALEVELESGPGWMSPNPPVVPDDVEPWAALLPGLDSTVMGWKDRSWFLPEAHVATLFDRNGNAGPTIWANGRVVGGWVQRPDGDIATKLLEEVNMDEQACLSDVIERTQQFLGDVVVRPRFPAPLQKQLLS